MDQPEFFPVPQLRNNVDYVDISTLEDFQSSSGGAKNGLFLIYRRVNIFVLKQDIQINIFRREDLSFQDCKINKLVSG